MLTQQLITPGTRRMKTHQKHQDRSSPSLMSDLNTVGIIPVKPRTEEDVITPPYIWLLWKVSFSIQLHAHCTQTHYTPCNVMQGVCVCVIHCWLEESADFKSWWRKIWARKNSEFTCQCVSYSQVIFQMIMWPLLRLKWCRLVIFYYWRENCAHEYKQPRLFMKQYFLFKKHENISVIMSSFFTSACFTFSLQL